MSRPTNKAVSPGLAAALVAGVLSVMTAVDVSPAAAATVGPCQSLIILPGDTTPNLGTGLSVAADPSGTMYVADPNNKRVLRFDAAGNQNLEITETDATPNFIFPNTVATDAAGNIYVASSSTQTIYRFDSTGTQNLAIPYANGTPDLQSAADVDTDSAGNIYVVDQFGDRLYRFNASGVQTLVIEASAATPALDATGSIAADDNGNIYTVDQFANGTYRFNAAGVQTLFIPDTNGNPVPISTLEVAVDSTGDRIVVGDFQGGVHRFDSTGTQTLYVAPSLPDPDFSQPGGVAVNAEHIYMADSSGTAIYRFAAGAASIPVSTEGEYRAALGCLGGDTGGPHTISLQADIVLSGSTDPAYGGAANLTIEGNGHTIDGGGSVRILTDVAGLTTMRNVTVRHGFTGANDGGGIDVDGPVVVENSTFADNTRGAIGTLGSITISNSTFLANTAPAFGGQVFTNGDVTVSNSTFAGGTGQVLRGEGASAEVTLRHVTLTGDPDGDALIGVFPGGLDSTASVVSRSGTGANCAVLGPLVSNGHNWADDGTCGLDEATDTEDDGGDPGLGPVRGNGDLAAAATENSAPIVSRLTRFPLNGSPLIDAIPAGSCSAAAELDVDQRGVARPFGAGCDIGAIESVFPAHTQIGVTPFYEATVRWVTSDVNTPQILSGFPDGSFGQTLNITRGQAARLYYNGAGAPDVSGLPFHGFSDGTTFFNDAITYAKANGIFDGFPDNTFRPNDPINRGNFIRSLYGFAGSQDVTALPAHPFTDVTNFYDNAVTWAKAQGLADGFPNNTFRQTNNINRGNASRTFYNTAQTPLAWADTMTAPPNMLFRSNLPPP